ncbi:MAG: TetM/TetW/TetO/TetS family tetracycline resistance ribosomal protection protein [Oscillospiraceae bacterium]|nr:TetM/TetW/TetO/TetS family tetracycline resistance ribosomal protection protein [Oscillospiraceae bacterium]
MSEQNKKRLCSIALLAHVDAGKTTLSEALLYRTGMRRQMGRVDHRDAFLDTHDLERSRGITIFSKLALMKTEHLDVTLVDTPGHVDFAAEAERTMPVLDCAVLVINGTDGVQAHTLTLWDLLRRNHVPTFLFINKMDLPGKSREELIKELQEKLSEHIVDFGADFDEIAEAAAVCDEALLEQYLESGEVTDTNLRGLIGSEKLFPCCFGSALKLQGVDKFLEVLDRYAPEPDYIPIGADTPPYAARVYKISRDPQGVRLTWLKVTGGSLKVRTPITYKDFDGREYTEKCVQLRRYSGPQFTPVEEAAAGMIVAVQGLSATWAGQPLGEDVRGFGNTLEPVMTYRLNLPADKDPLLFLPKLRQLEEEDPQLRVKWDERLRQIHVSLMGKVQLEILTSLIAERFGTQVTFDQGRISYKETILGIVEGVGHFEPLRHYAETHLLLEPLAPGSGIYIDTKCSTDVLDWQYQKLIISHISEKTHLGVLTGSPITDIKITLMAGRAHLKHTEGGDFRQATYRAVRQGLMQAKSRLLEPWYEFTLTVPTPMIGRAITDIRAMSGEFDSPEPVGGNSTLRGTVPVSEVGDYAADVAAYTHGTGIFQTRLLGYRPCHNEDAVVAALGYDPEADVENTPDSVFCAHGAGFNVKWNEVPNYMHIASVLEKPKQPELVMQNLRMDDRELEKIMEREFGPVKRRQYTAPKNQSASDKMPIAPPREHLLIIDGYNVLFNWPELNEMAKIDLGLARTRLIEILGDFAAFKNYRMVLVFDGYRAKGNPGQKSRWEKVEIVYTKEGQTGDAYIESLATRIGHNYSTRVVTSDSLVQLSSFRSGLLRMSARELRESVESAQGEITDLLTKLQYSENRRFHEK